MSVGFFTAVSFREPQTLSQTLLGVADSYLSLGCLGCRSVEVILGFAKEGREAAFNDPSSSSCFVTALKIVSYLTVILPLLALVTKVMLRCSNHFYLHSKEKLSEEILKKVRESKPLSDAESKFLPFSRLSVEILKKVKEGKSLNNEDWKFLPLSRLTTKQIESILRITNYTVEFPKLRERFALIPAAEVAEALYKDIIPSENYVLVSEKQCRELNISRSKNVWDVILESSMAENLLQKGDKEGEDKRIQAKVANIKTADLEKALILHYGQKSIYRHLSDQHLKELNVNKLEKDRLRILLLGLCRHQLNAMKKEVIESNLPLIRRRFAFLNIQQLREVASKDPKCASALEILLSKPSSFQADEFGKFTKSLSINLQDLTRNAGARVRRAFGESKPQADQTK